MVLDAVKGGLGQTAKQEEKKRSLQHQYSAGRRIVDSRFPFCDLFYAEHRTKKRKPLQVAFSFFNLVEIILEFQTAFFESG